VRELITIEAVRVVEEILLAKRAIARHPRSG